MNAKLMKLMASFQARSLRARLLLLVFLALIPALALILYTDRDQRRMAEKQARENLVRISQVINDENKLLVEGIRQLLAVLAHLPAVRQQNVTACDETMEALAQEYRQYVSLGAVKPNGVWFCAGNFTDPISIANRQWFQRAVKTREFTIGNYQVAPEAQRAVLPLAYPSIDEAGKIRAVVLAAVDLEWLKMMVARSVLPQGSTVTIVDDQGMILAHHPTAGEQWIGKSIAGTPLEKALRTGRDGLHSSDGVDGIRRFAVFSSLGSGNEPGAVRLILSTPQDEVFAEAHRVLRRNLLWLAPVFLAVFAAAWFGGEFFVVRQVNGLLNSARRIAAGDFNARTGLSYASGELGQLAQSFDEMAGSLEARQREARRAATRARENERLAVMGATAATITHEIANPLSGMYTTVQFMEQQLHEPDKLNIDTLSSDVENLKDEIERLRVLLEDLRDFIRSGQLKLKSVSLGEVAAEIVTMEFHNHNERGIKAELDFPASLPSVMADREKLKQVVLNLCKNAADAMPQGGKLMLRGFQNDKEMVLEVKDTGPGIPNEVDVFEFFATTKPHGLGLGLAIVRQIIAAHGGEISYSSEPNAGTAFRVTLPLAKTAAEQDSVQA
jgi:signal transduction histidine kinase